MITGGTIHDLVGVGMADVIVVGAGLSGLMAARKILKSQETASVVVLEARDRVGGRMFAQQVGGKIKGWIDLGGQWIGEGQARMKALAEELGLEVFESYTDGPAVIRYDGHRHLDDNEIPAPSIGDRKATEDLLQALSRAADLVVPDVSRPWASPLAAAYDRLTIGQWIDANSNNEYARFYLGIIAALDQAGGSLQEVSLLHSLFERKANPIGGEPEKYLIRGAAGQIPPLLSRQLGDDKAIRLNSKAAAIHQGTNGVTVSAITPQGYIAYEGRAVIVAIPPWLAGAISYTSSVQGQPSLPARRIHLTQRMAMGTIAKVVCVYDTPWWRTSKERLSGTSYSRGRLAGFTADSSLPGDEGPGILIGFIQGDVVFEWMELPPEGRKEWVSRDLVELFGEDARNPAAYVEALWPQDQFTGGAYNAYLPPGGWTSYGCTIREPFGRISWAGTETAAEWFGYFDGAATAGERAAEEVLTKWL
jgi:monoamine oxidase